MNERTTTIGKLLEIWRYPVSSLAGERLELARVDAGACGAIAPMRCLNCKADRWPIRR